MKESIKALLQELDIPHRWVDHPPVFTVAESTRLIEDKRPIKNILLEEKGTGRTVLVIIAGEQRVDSKLIAQELSTRKLQFAPPEKLEQVLGVQPGAVSIFGLLHPGAADIRVVIDQNLLAAPELGFHPNDNKATIFIPGSSLEAVVQKTGHEYKILNLY